MKYSTNVAALSILFLGTLLPVALLSGCGGGGGGSTPNPTASPTPTPTPTMTPSTSTNDTPDPNAPNEFTFPVLMSISPDHGPVAGGTTVTIKGKYFTGRAKPIVLRIAGSVPTTMTVVDDETITAVTGVCPAPEGGTGPVNLTADSLESQKPNGIINYTFE